MPRGRNEGGGGAAEGSPSVRTNSSPASYFLPGAYGRKYQNSIIRSMGNLKSPNYRGHFWISQIKMGDGVRPRDFPGCVSEPV